MKQLLTLVAIITLSLTTFKSYSQLTINQSFSPTSNLKVGDTLSVKYTIDKGKVEINIVQENDHLVISIADDGIGIPADQTKDIFMKFFRARNAIKHEANGSGLGLFIAKEIVEKNGGKLWFEGREGGGTTFYFTVPLEGNNLQK